MLSFLTQRRDAGRSAEDDDPSSRASSAHDLAGGGGLGGRSPPVPRDATTLRVDRSVRHLDGRQKYGRLFSMELPPAPIRMDVNLTQGTSCLPPSKIVRIVSTMISDSKAGDVFKSEGLRHLRNVAFPPELEEKDLPTFDNASDLGKILPAQRNRSLAFSFLCNGYALRDRFDGLPVHRACYYHSHDTAEVALNSLKEALELESFLHVRGCASARRRRDCLGFTPLHILCCSTRHRREMYELMTEQNPEDLFAEDKWGEVPLLYAFWGGAPQPIVELLTAAMKQLRPDCTLAWGGMMQTLCRAAAPPACLERLIETAREEFPEHEFELDGDDWGSMLATLCAEGKASEEHVARYLPVCRAALTKGRKDISHSYHHLILNRKFGFKPFWIKVPIADRVSALPKREWREDLESMIAECPTSGSERAVRRRAELTGEVHDRLDLYETTERLWAVELALWKARIEATRDDEGGAGNSRDHDARRSQCRIKSGADVVVPNVMPFLRNAFDFRSVVVGEPRQHRRT